MSHDTAPKLRLLLCFLGILVSGFMGPLWFRPSLPGSQDPEEPSKACLGLAEAPWEPPRGRIPHTPCWALHQPLNLGPEFSTGRSQGGGLNNVARLCQSQKIVHVLSGGL